MAERSIIDTMARAIMEARDPDFGNGSGCKVIDWRSEARDNPHVAQAVAQARAALQAPLEAGPTEAMVEAGANAIENTELRAVWEGDPKGFFWAWMDCSKEAFLASLRAALEEADNAR
jgi:hypothetical protein